MRRSTASLVAASVAVVASGGCHDAERSVPTVSAVAADGPAMTRAPAHPSVSILDPQRLTSGRRGTFYVTDYLQGMVFELALRRGSLEVRDAFTVPGRPLGIAWYQNRLFVGDRVTGTVNVFGPNGRWRYDLGGPGAVTDPKDIAIDDRARLVFVLDGAERTVKVFDARRGKFRQSFGRLGVGLFDFQNPSGVAVDPPRREVLVSDYGDALLPGSPPPRVIIFGYNGARRGWITGATGSGYRFSRPIGLTVDEAGHVFVVDALSGTVVVLDRETGATLNSLGGLGSGPRDLWLPLDVVVGEGLDILVTSNRARRVQLFPGGGIIP